MKYIFLILIYLFGLTQLFGQDKMYSLKIYGESSILSKKEKNIKEKIDSLMIKQKLKEYLYDLNAQGYLAASIDSLVYDSLSVKAWLNVGEKFSWGIFCLDSIDPFILRKLGIKSEYFENRIVRISQFNKIRDKIINYYENSGYPFASIVLKDVNINNTTISGTLFLEKNGLILIKDVIIKGNASITKKYFTKYTGVEPGRVYEQKKIKGLKKRISEIGFVNEIKTTEIEFDSGEAVVYSYLENKKANSFSGVLGFLPDSKKDNKLILTGEVNLYLINSFKRGEQIAFEWMKPDLSAQELNIKFVYPYIFSLPVAIDTEFELYKKDSTYLTLDIDLGIRFMFEGDNYLKTNLRNKQASIISTNGLESLTVLPPYADIKTSLLGMAYHFGNLDYKYNPRKGVLLNFYIGIGQRKIKKNSKIPGIVYQGLSLKTKQLEIQSNISYYKTLSEKWVLKIQNKSGYLNNPELFDNEMFRLGGLKTIRGFDESAILASGYSIFTLEYRFLFEQNSNLFLFCDGGYYEKNSHYDVLSDFPFGFGTGVNFETKAGIFSLSYALGKQFDNPIQLKSAKIHFGFTSKF